MIENEAEKYGTYVIKRVYMDNRTMGMTRGRFRHLLHIAHPSASGHETPPLARMVTHGRSHSAGAIRNTCDSRCIRSIFPVRRLAWPRSFRCFASVGDRSDTKLPIEASPICGYQSRMQ